MTATLVSVGSDEALRDRLDAMNEQGIDPLVVGVDAAGRSFLVTLQGPYAETEAVLLGIPWDSEVDWSSGRRCDECGCSEAFGLDDLTFPVDVVEVSS